MSRIRPVSKSPQDVRPGLQSHPLIPFIRIHLGEEAERARGQVRQVLSGAGRAWIDEKARNLRGASDLCSGSGEALGLHWAGAPSHTLPIGPRVFRGAWRDATAALIFFGGAGSTRTGHADPSKESPSGRFKGVVRAVQAAHTLVSRFGSLARGLRSKGQVSSRSQVFGQHPSGWVDCTDRHLKGCVQPAIESRLRFGIYGAGRKETPLQPSLVNAREGDREERGRRWRHVASCVLQRFEGPPLSVLPPR